MPVSRHDPPSSSYPLPGAHAPGGSAAGGARELGRVVGRYVLYDEIASGGMASVYFGRMTGAVGFSRTVAIKRLHPHLAKDPDFVAMILDEARLAARIVHPNVVQTLDVVTDGPPPGEIFIVMEYVQGESLSRLQRALSQRGERTPIATATTILGGVLHGLHAAHEAKTEQGAPLGIVHRDVSPQNVMLGADGSVRILDFGVAKAAGRMQSTREGSIKGKIPYMAPEQIRGGQVTRSCDVYAASVVLWELLTGRRLFEAENEVILIHRITAADPHIAPPSHWNPDVSPELDALVLRGLASLPEQRFASAREMAQALERAAPLVPSSRLGEWVEDLAQHALSKRASVLAAIESQPAQPPTASPNSSAVFAATLRLAEAPSTARDFAQTAKYAETLNTHAGTTLTTDARKGVRRARVALLVSLVTVLFGAAAGVGLWVILRSSPAPATMSADMPATPALASTPLAAARPIAETTPTLPPVPPVTSVATVAAPNKAKSGGPRRSCNPPYEVDANGIKTYKRECLR